MTNKTLKKIYFAYGILLSALLIISGVLLIISCVSIYNIGDEPFTPENISAAFEKINVPVYITLGAVLLGALLKIALPPEKEKAKAKMSEKATLARLEKKLDKETCDKELSETLAKSKKLLAVIKIAIAALTAALAIPSLLFVFNLNNFTLKTNESVMAACTYILPWAFIAAGLLVGYSYIEKAILNRQIALLKPEVAKHNLKITEQTECKCCKKKRETNLLIARLVILFLAVGLIIAGIFNGGMADVLAKAVNICTECIGLG